MIHPELREKHGDYGFDGQPLQGLIPIGGGGLIAGGLGIFHRRKGHDTLAAIEAITSLALLATFGFYLQSTRRGKFLAWADVLERLQLRGDENILDVGCGRGAVLAMAAKLLPRGRAVGLDLWTADQSGNHPEATRRNLIAEGVSDRCELLTGNMLSMPYADGIFDTIVSSLAIHNVDEHNVFHHDRRLQAIDEAVRVLKPGGRLAIADIAFTGVYAQRLRELGMDNVQVRSLGWRFWYGPFVGAKLVSATKPQSD